MDKTINTISDAVGLKQYWDVVTSQKLKEQRASHADRQLQRVVFNLIDLMQPESLLIMMTTLENGLEKMKNGG